MIDINTLKLAYLPNIRMDIASTFGLKIAARIPAFSNASTSVPWKQIGFKFECKIVLCVLSGLVYNAYVLIVGRPGMSKSIHIEQVCSRLN